MVQQATSLADLESDRARLQAALQGIEAWRALQQLEAREAVGEWFDAIEGGLLREKLLAEVAATDTARDFAKIDNAITALKNDRSRAAAALAKSSTNLAPIVPAENLQVLAKAAGFDTYSVVPASKQDDLTKIDGIDAAIAAGLNGIGITSFADIAAWRSVEIGRVAKHLGLGRRVDTQNWVGQATELALKQVSTKVVEHSPVEIVALQAEPQTADTKLALPSEKQPAAEPALVRAPIEIVPPPLPKQESSPRSAEPVLARPFVISPQPLRAAPPAIAANAFAGRKPTLPRAVLGPSLKKTAPRPAYLPPVAPASRKAADPASEEAHVTIVVRGPRSAVPPPLPQRGDAPRRPVLPGIGILEASKDADQQVLADVTISRSTARSTPDETAEPPAKKVRRFLNSLTGEQ